MSLFKDRFDALSQCRNRLFLTELNIDMFCLFCTVFEIMNALYRKHFIWQVDNILMHGHLLQQKLFVCISGIYFVFGCVCSGTAMVLRQ